MVWKLKDLVAPHSVAEFLDGYYGVQPLHVGGATARFARVCDSELERRLEYELEAAVSAAREGGESAAPRRLERDLVVLQVAGGNRWLLGAEAASEALTLEAGGVLYLPRGWWRAIDEGAAGSERVALTLHNPTGLDVLDWMLDALRREACFDGDIPRFAGPAAQADWQTAIWNAVAALCRPPGLAQRVMRHRNESAAPRPAVAAPVVSRDRVFDVAARRPWRVRRASEGTVYIVVAGKPLLFDEAAAPLLEYIRDEAPAPLSTLFETFQTELTDEEIGELVVVLAQHGLISLVAPDAAV